MTNRIRADRLLVQRGLFESRAKAQAAIAAGLVSADDAIVAKASDEIAPDAVLHAEAAHPWVSRGGVKLSAALEFFAINPKGRVCLDVGASTGGFTDVLVARGAKCVYAVDVGTGQLHAKLRADPRVIALEKTDIRRLSPSVLPQAPDLVVADVSFISLKQVLPSALALAARPLQMIALIKPQFELGRGRSKKGVVRQPGLHAKVCNDIAVFLESLGCTVLGVVASPIAGSDGNREFLIGAKCD
jgi:23S rRNA (cytidine1920-2'-O)/16S rRNA (cytidine1409-2'-O)-methyltransferase